VATKTPTSQIGELLPEIHHVASCQKLELCLKDILNLRPKRFKKCIIWDIQKLFFVAFTFLLLQ
jgi:hypothetical protein